jgi:hypothetical protein
MLDGVSRPEPLGAAASVAGAVLLLVSLPPLWAAVSWLSGQPGPGVVGAVVVLLDGLLLLAAGVLTWWRPRDWWPWATGGGLLLGALQWLLELVTGTPTTWLVSAVCGVVLVWFVLGRLPGAAPEDADAGQRAPSTSSR